MKKKLLIVMMMLCSIILVGCVDADVTVDLEKDGTGKAIVDVVGPKTLFDNIPQSTIDEWGKSFENVEKIKKSDKTGYKFITRQGAIDEVLKEVTGLNESLGDSKQVSSTNNEDSTNSLANELYEKYVDVKEENSLFSSTYNIDLKLKDAIYSEMTNEQKAVVSFIGRSANIGLHIKSPIKAEYSNATSETQEDGKYIYNWEYTLGDVKNINFSAKIPNIRNIAIAGICVLIVLLIVLIRFLFRRKK